VSAVKTLVGTASPDDGLVDWRGTPIEIGSTIVYPGRGSSALWMAEGIVEGIGTRHRPSEGRTVPMIQVRRTHERGREVRTSRPRPVTIEVIKRVTVVPPRVT